MILTNNHKKMDSLPRLLCIGHHCMRPRSWIATSWFVLTRPSIVVGSDVFFVFQNCNTVTVTLETQIWRNKKIRTNPLCGFWKLLYCNAWNAENGFWKLLYCYIVTLEPMVSSDLFLLTVTFASVFLRHLLAYRDTSILQFWKSTVLAIHTTSWEAHYELP